MIALHVVKRVTPLMAVIIAACGYGEAEFRSKLRPVEKAKAQLAAARRETKAAKSQLDALLVEERLRSSAPVALDEDKSAAAEPLERPAAPGTVDRCVDVLANSFEPMLPGFEKKCQDRGGACFLVLEAEVELFEGRADYLGMAAERTFDFGEQGRFAAICSLKGLR